MKKQILKVKNLSKFYDLGRQKIHILKDINFVMNKGDFTSIRGASGVGKSTFLNILGALDKPDSGDVIIDGHNISKYREDEQLSFFRREKIGFIFQDHYLMQDFNILENVMMPLMIKKIKKKEAKIMASEILDRVGLSHRLSHYPNQISGGESQRVAAARAIVHKPAIILADEPTGNIDSKNTIKFIELLKGIQEKDSLTILVVTHEDMLGEMALIYYDMIDGQINQRK